MAGRQIEGKSGRRHRLLTTHDLAGIIDSQGSGGGGGTNDYNDLINKPILGTAATKNITDFASAAQGAKADSAVQSVVAGTNVTVDNTDPHNPVVSVTTSTPSDPNFSSVLALLDFSSDAIVDVKGNTWTRSGSGSGQSFVGRQFNLGYSSRSFYPATVTSLTSTTVTFGGNSTPWTVEGWFYVASTAVGTTRFICGQSTNSGLFIPSSSTNGYFSFYANATDKYVIKSLSPVTLGQHYYVLNWDGTTLTLALDGMTIGTSTKQLSTSNGQFYICSNTSGDSSPDFLGPHRITVGISRNSYTIPTTVFPNH